MKDDNFTAIIINPKDGNVIDFSYYWETTQTLINEGFRAVQLLTEGSRSRSEWQELWDAERASYVDCFRVFDLLDETDAEEYYYGHDCEA